MPIHYREPTTPPPPPPAPPAPSLPTRDTSRKSYISEPGWLRRFIDWLKFNNPFYYWEDAYIDEERPKHKTNDEQTSPSPPPKPDPRITPTTMRGNYPSTQKQLEKDYDRQKQKGQE